MYVCMYGYVYVYVYVYMYMYRGVCMHICMHVCMYVCMYNMYVYIKFSSIKEKYLPVMTLVKHSSPSGSLLTRVLGRLTLEIFATLSIIVVAEDSLGEVVTHGQRCTT